jgi:hypothetical protein
MQEIGQASYPIRYREGASLRSSPLAIGKSAMTHAVAGK